MDIITIQLVILLITFTLLSVIAGGFSLYPKNKKYRKIIAKLNLLMVEIEIIQIH